jgi:isopentenyldiphosphate isomerase
MLFYVSILKEFQEVNEHGIWLTLDEARQTQWVQTNRMLFESMYQEAKYLRGDFERSYLDIYDETGKTMIGTESYDTIHRQGFWHRGVHVFILTPDGKFVIQKRGPDVQTKPNMLESSAGGHINTGHSAVETVIYELHEEIGITVTEDEIEYVGEIVDQFTEQAGTIINNEFDSIYIIRKDIQGSDIVIGRKEVSEVVFIDAKDFLERGINLDPTVAHRPAEYQILYNYLFNHEA